MVAGVLSAVVLTASMSIQVLAADSNTVFTSGEPQGAAIAVTGKSWSRKAGGRSKESRGSQKGRGGKKGRGRASEKAGPGGGYFSSGGIDLLWGRQSAISRAGCSWRGCDEPIACRICKYTARCHLPERTVRTGYDRKTGSSTCLWKYPIILPSGSGRRAIGCQSGRKRTAFWGWNKYRNQDWSTLVPLGVRKHQIDRKRVSYSLRSSFLYWRQDRVRACQ